MTERPSERLIREGQQRLELRNLSRSMAERGVSVWSVPPGCGCVGWLLIMVVLVLGGVIGYQMWHQHSQKGGLVKEQTVTLASGSRYALTSSGELKPSSGSAGYLLSVTASGLGFADGVHADTAPTWGAEYDDPCIDLDLPGTGNAASFPWTRLGDGTQLCAEPQGGADPYDYLMTVKSLTPGQQLQVDIVTWDPEKAAPNR